MRRGSDIIAERELLQKSAVVVEFLHASQTLIGAFGIFADSTRFERVKIIGGVERKVAQKGEFARRRAGAAKDQIGALAFALARQSRRRREQTKHNGDAKAPEPTRISARCDS